MRMWLTLIALLSQLVGMTVGGGRQVLEVEAIFSVENRNVCTGGEAPHGFTVSAVLDNGEERKVLRGERYWSGTLTLPANTDFLVVRPRMGLGWKPATRPYSPDQIPAAFIRTPGSTAAERGGHLAEIVPDEKPRKWPKVTVPLAADMPTEVYCGFGGRRWWH